MDIELHGLTPKEQAFCDVMWAISTKEGVDNFIATLPTADQRTCKSLIECMQLAFMDEIEDTSAAEKVLARFTL